MTVRHRNGRSRARAVIRLAMLIGLAAMPPARGGEAFVCPGADVRIQGVVAERALAVCDVAAQTVAFMRDHGFAATPALSINLVGDLPHQNRAARLGQFDARTGEIRILDLRTSRQAARSDPAFGLAMTPALHRSFVAHEVAHAVAHVNFVGSRPSVEAHEYIAYTVQLSMMPKRLRASVLAGYPQPGFADASEISATYLALNPSAFAVKAYRHFNGIDDSSAFYRYLLSGEFRPSPGWE